MFAFCLCKRFQSLIIPNCGISSNFITHLQFLDGASFFSKYFSSNGSLPSVQDKQPPHSSFTVSYLVNSCGLSRQTAESISKYVILHSSKNPDSVLALLRKHGFTSSQIHDMVKNRPSLLALSADKIILPKLEFFYSIGLSSTDLPAVMAGNTSLLVNSLKKLVTNHNFLITVLSSEIIVESLRKNKKTRLFSQNVQMNFAPNISVLKGLGIPQSSISQFVTRFPNVLSGNAKRFEEQVKKLIEMGLNPSSISFVKALGSFCRMSESTWEHKMEALKKWGWSEGEIWSGFGKTPYFMVISEKSITKKMDFIVNKMGFQSASVAGQPMILTYSLEKRIIPRFLVIKALQSKGLAKEMDLLKILIYSDKSFLDKFVLKYQENLPRLLSIFQGKVGFERVGSDFESVSG